jgi:hypothetical protein
MTKMHWQNGNDREKSKHSRKAGRSATLSTTNPIGTRPGENPTLRAERPATNNLRPALEFGLLGYDP